MTFRDAVPGDAAPIVDFQIAMASETEGVTLDREVCTRGVRAVFDDPNRGRYLVAEAGGRVVGSLLITYEWSDWRDGNIWWIQSVYIVAEMRRRGVYAGMYRYIMNHAQLRPDVRGIRLYVDRRNENAQKVYTRLGMNGDHYQVFEWMK